MSKPLAAKGVGPCLKRGLNARLLSPLIFAEMFSPDPPQTLSVRQEFAMHCIFAALLVVVNAPRLLGYRHNGDIQE
ncbi:hypothetical protein [Sphingomonas psychrolutea]|nr:hypothetical protein [Sphingomonas psychrolutea]